MSNPRSMYDLEGEWLGLLAALEDTFDETTGEYSEPTGIDEAFAALGEDVEVKLAGCAHVLRRLKADSAMVAEEEKRLAARRKRIDASRQRLEERVRELMLLTETPRVKTPTISLTLAKASMRVEVVGPVPAQYLTTPVMPEPKPMLAEIKKALRKGARIPGACLIEGKRSLRIT